MQEWTDERFCCMAAVRALLPRPVLSHRRLAGTLLSFVLALSTGAPMLQGQRPSEASVSPGRHAEHRTRQFLRGRATRPPADGAAVSSPAALLAQAREQHRALATAQATSLNAPWTAIGPVQVQTARYGLVTGRVTAVTIDPADSTGNTVYVGTSGGGVWKSTNAAGTAASVTFLPLTDWLPAFSPNAGTSAVPSLSIGALSVQPGGTGVVLAGTGDTNNATDSYYGSGLLRSTDNGASWSLIQRADGGWFTGEGFAGLAWSTSSPGTVVAAVSSAEESSLVQDSKYPGVRGLYYSRDGGATWTVATLSDGSNLVQYLYTSFQNFRGNAATSVVWNPVRQKFYAAIRYHGYYESADGQNWTRMVNQPGVGLSAANCPTRTGDYGLSGCPIFRGALAVQPVSGDIFALTVDANNNDVGLWQDTCNLTGSGCASSTVNWGTQLNVAPMEDGGRIAEGDYTLSLAAVPAATAVSVTDTLLFAGTTDLYRCGLFGGCTLRNTTNTGNGCAAPAGVAPAQHAIAWQANPGNTSAPRMFFGNDGGLWRSLDGVRQQAQVCSADDATHFDNLNGALGSLAEIFGFTSHPTDANTLLAALGANGSAASTTAAQAGNTAAWAQLSDGESGTVAIDQSNGQTWLVQSGAGVSLHACTNGSACTAADFAGPAAIAGAQVQGDSALVEAPAMLDPVLNTNVIAGTCRVFRGPATGGSTWSSSSAISRFLAGPSGPACNSSDAFIRSLGAGGAAVLANGSQNSGSPILYAGLAGSADGGSTYGGHLFVTAAAQSATSSTPWTDAAVNPVSNGNGTAFNAGGFDISSIAVDPNDATGRTVYATIMGFGYPHLYRSTDAGSTWLNISANLPDAPANSVAVDPNNPRIVYVALDTGVYAATDVTTCVDAATGATSNCWGVLGTRLPNAPVLSLIASRGIGSGVLRAGTFGRGIWQIPLLSAGESLLPVATFSPANLAFASQPVGATGTAQTATLTNTGNTPLQITTLDASAGFLETDTCANTTLTVNQSCTISVAFAPAAPGTLSGTVNVHGDISGGYASLPLSGVGQGVSNLLLAPVSVAFPQTAIGSTSASQTVTVINTGTGGAILTAPAASPDFNIAATTCGATLAPGSSCAISLTFTPSQSTEIGTLTLADADATYIAQLQGTGSGTASISITPASVYFGDAIVNGAPSQATLTITNTGTITASLGKAAATGDFVVSQNTCGGTLPAGGTCMVTVDFVPAVPGARSGVFTLSDAFSAHTAALSGNGIATTANFSPAALTFNTTDVGATSAPQTVTVTNTGTYPLDWGVLAAAGDFGIPANTCIGSLQAGSTCSFQVNFTPVADGPRYGSITLPDSRGIHTVLLSGTGHGLANITIAPASLSFGTVAVHSTSSPQTISVINSGTAAIALNSPVLSGDFFLAGSTCGSSLAAGSRCSLTVDFAPLAGGVRTGAALLTDANGSHTVALSGNGSGQPIVTLSPVLLVFPSTALNGTAAAQSITVSNGGPVDATLAAPTVTGDFHVVSNTCGTTLAANSRCMLSVTFTPSTSGARSGLLSIAEGPIQHNAALAGTGVAGSLSAAPSSLAFLDTPTGSSSAVHTVTVTNTGNGALTIATVTASSDYTVSGGCVGTTLAAGAACTLHVTFTPTAAGPRPGTLTIAAGSGSSAMVALSGNGTGAFAVVLTPASVDFGPVLTGTDSPVRNVTLSNTGTTAGELGAITISGNFTLRANTCGTSLPPQTGCTVSVVFTPAAAGVRMGVLTVNDAAGTQTATLTGTGTAAATDTLTPLSLTFGSQQVNTASETQTVTLTNNGDVALTLVSAQILTGDFLATNGCGPTLPAHASCAVSIVFAPKSVGKLTGTLQVTDVQHAQTVALSGSAIAGPGVSLSPANLSFANTGVGVAGAGQILTLTNNGGTPLTIGGVMLAGDFGILAGGRTTCTPGMTLAVGSACTVDVAFLPTAAGGRAGSVTITSNAPTQTAQFTGTGVDFQLLANGGTSLTVASGANAVFPLLLRPAVNTADPVTYACTGAPANAKCTITSQYGDLSAVQTVSVTVLTGTTALHVRSPIAMLMLPLLGLPWIVRRRAPYGIAAALTAAFLLASTGGCGSGIHSAAYGDGSGSTGTGGATPVTPGGTYNILASATAAGVTHTVPLTLVVK